jgi:endonuclease YncB( thermonuclease family)
VVDGDTLDVEFDSGVRVRMWGLDTPRPLFGEAAALIHQLLDGHQVEPQPSNQTSYDRMIARVFVDGTDVDTEVVKRGLTMAERRYLGQFSDGMRLALFS